MNTTDHVFVFLPLLIFVVNTQCFFFCSVSEWVEFSGKGSVLAGLEPCLLNLDVAWVAAHARRSGTQSKFCCLRIFVCLSKNTTSDRTKIWYRERNCQSSWLPSAQGLGYPWAAFWPHPGFCSSVHSLMKKSISSCVAQGFVSFSYCYFCFTVASVPSSLNPNNDHNRISSTCLYLKSCSGSPGLRGVGAGCAAVAAAVGLPLTGP